MGVDEMLLRILGLSLLVALLPLPATAQTKTLEELTEDVKQLSSDLQQLRESAATAAALETLENRVTKTNDALSKTAENLTATAQDVLNNKNALAENGQRIDTLISQVTDQLARQQLILESISEKDEKGNNVLRLDGLMNTSEKFRQHMEDAVHRSLRTTGKITITNKMASYQEVQVNRNMIGIGAGETREIVELPVGTVTVRLAGQKTTNWTIGAPDYEENIDIVPTTRWSVSKVLPPVAPLAPAVPTANGPLYITPHSSYYFPAQPWFGY